MYMVLCGIQHTENMSVSSTAGYTQLSSSCDSSQSHHHSAVAQCSLLISGLHTGPMITASGLNTAPVGHFHVKLITCSMPPHLTVCCTLLSPGGEGQLYKLF